MRTCNLVVNGGKKMAEGRRQLLTIGAFLIILVVAILLYAGGVLGLALVVPVVLVLLGIWMLALAVIRSANPQKYERSSFSTIGQGLMLIAVGGALYLYSFNWLYSVALVLLVLAAIAIAASLRRK
jgi:O-antigen/teichoic acid export membrane protein